MSATRDQGQKFKFIYANLYQIYRNEKPQMPPKAPLAPQGLVYGQVIKSADAHSVASYSPMQILKKPEAPKVQMTPNSAVQGLRDNLNKLSELHSRLRFMLKELEELTK